MLVFGDNEEDQLGLGAEVELTVLTLDGSRCYSRIGTNDDGEGEEGKE